MDYNSPSSLVFYSSVKIASTLFCHQDLVDLEQKQLHLVGWVQVQDSVAQLVQSLQLPKNIEENVQELIQPIGDQIRRWLSKRCFITEGKVDLYDIFSWTSHGMIDYQKTAKNLIERGQLDLCLQFTLANVDGIADFASYIYVDPQKLSQVVFEDNTIPVDKVDNKTAYEFCLMMQHFVSQPPEVLNTSPLGPAFYENAVSMCAINGNTALTRFFLTHIVPHKRASLVRAQVLKILKTNNRFVNLDTLLFLLSQIDTRQISELFVENTEHVLLRFLEWPLQQHFMKLASKLWHAMSPLTFASVLQAIVQHIIQHCSISTNPFGYRDIFRDFWLSSPAEYRIICVNELIIPIMSSLFCSHGYFTTVLNLFGNVSYCEKLEVLFFSNADAVLEIVSNENKARAFESIVKRYFSPADIPLNFGEKYNFFTQKYVEGYYGEAVISD